MRTTPTSSTARKNHQFLTSLEPETRKAIVDNIANHYRISAGEVLDEIYHEEAECILEYITGETRATAFLLMQEFTQLAHPFKNHREAVNRINARANEYSRTENVSLGFARLDSLSPRVKMSTLLYFEVHLGLNAVTEGVKVLDAAIKALGSMSEADYKDYVLQKQFLLSIV